MTLTEFRYIVALAQERHFGRAAEKCFVSQPTLSVAVKKFEEELGAILFERGASEIRMTPLGERVVRQAERILAETKLLKELAASGGDPLSGPLRLGTIYTIGPYLLPRLVSLLKESAPRMPLMLEENFTVKLLESLKNGDLDAAILAWPIAEPGLAAQAAYDEELRVLLPADHAWARKAAIDAAALIDQPLLMLGRNNCFRDQVLDLCARAGAGGPQVLEGSSLETIRLMVASGVGISVMPASAVDGLTADDALLRVRPFTAPTPTRRVGLVWRVGFPRHRAIDAVRSALRACRLPGTQTL